MNHHFINFVNSVWLIEKKIRKLYKLMELYRNGSKIAGTDGTKPITAIQKILKLMSLVTQALSLKHVQSSFGAYKS